MNKLILTRVLQALLPVLIGAQAVAQSELSPCEEAWVAYNEFKRRTVMEPSQYPLTMQGAAVRAACGADALPAPARVDAVPTYVAPGQPARRRPDGHRKPDEHPRLPDTEKPRDHAEPPQKPEPHDDAQPPDAQKPHRRPRPSTPPTGAPRTN